MDRIVTGPISTEVKKQTTTLDQISGGGENEFVPVVNRRGEKRCVLK